MAPLLDGSTAGELIPELVRHLPVIMFSNSNARSDVAAAYEHGANAYLLKPMEYAEIKEAMGDLVRFWWDRAQLPMTSATTTSA